MASRANVASNSVRFPAPADGVVTSTFGDRVNPVTKANDFHTGIDIAANHGSKALAMADGIVTQVSENKFNGIFVRYETDNGFEIVYLHLSKTLCKTGQRIRVGDVLGLTGNTGQSTGAHLHYSIKKEGNYVDPLLYTSYELNQNAQLEIKNRNLVKNEVIGK